MEQLSEEWFEARYGKFTASRIKTVAVNGKGLITYCKELFNETIGIHKPKLNTPDINRGINLESVAIDKYENKYFVIVESCGFVENPDFPNSGASPDGLIGEDGSAEVKCINDEKFKKLILNFKIETNHLYQMIFQSMHLKRKWCEYIVYNENIFPHLLVKRVYLKEHRNIRREIILGLKSGNRILNNLRKDYVRSSIL